MNPSRLSWTAILLTLIFFSTFAKGASPSLAPASTRPTQPDMALPAAADRALPEISFDGVGLSDVIDFLRDVTGANFFIDWKEIEAAGIDRNLPITMKEKNIRISRLLDGILAGASAGGSRLAWGYEDGAIVISTPEGVSRLEALGAARTQRELHGGSAKALQVSLPVVQIDGVGLSDVFDFLAEKGRVKIVVDWKMLEEAGIDRNAPISITVRELKLEHALDLVLYQAGNSHWQIHYLIDAGGHISIQLRALNPATRPSR